MRLEEKELNWIQRNFRYAAINFKEQYPELITAHITDVWRKESYEITAYYVIDGQPYRCDAEVTYDGIENAEDFEQTVLTLLDTMMEEFKENNK